MSADLTSLLRDALYPRHKAAECKRAACHPCPTYDDQARRIAAVIKSSDWLAAHDREVAAGAVEAAADETDDNCLYGWTFPNGVLRGWDHDDDKAEEVTVHDWLHDRAQAIREGADDDE